MKKILALALALALLLTMGCTAFADLEWDPDAIYFQSSTDDPTHMDPALCTDGQSTTITGLVFSALIGYNLDGSIFPDVAESWDVSDDVLTYTFHIRKGIKFHDGTTLDANAVKWNWDRIVPEPVGHGTADMPYSEVLFGNIASYQVIDDLTFEATLKQPDTDTLILLGSNSLAAAIVSPTASITTPSAPAPTSSWSGSPASMSAWSAMTTIISASPPTAASSAVSSPRARPWSPSS